MHEYTPDLYTKTSDTTLSVAYQKLPLGRDRIFKFLVHDRNEKACEVMRNGVISD